MPESGARDGATKKGSIPEGGHPTKLFRQQGGAHLVASGSSAWKRSLAATVRYRPRIQHDRIVAGRSTNTGVSAPIVEQWQSHHTYPMSRPDGSGSPVIRSPRRTTIFHPTRTDLAAATLNWPRPHQQKRKLTGLNLVRMTPRRRLLAAGAPEAF